MKAFRLALCVLLAAYQIGVCKLSDLLVKVTGGRVFVLPFFLPPSVFVWTSAAFVVLESQGHGGE